MVVARNIGRLGNNLFQIGAAMGYARKYGYQWAVDLNSGLSEPYSSIHTVFPHLPKEHPNGRRYHEHPDAICAEHKTHYNNCHFDYHTIPDLGPDVALTGFFQSWKYFENCDDLVRKCFKLNDYPEYRNHVGIHVRRGDYVHHAHSFPPITIDYLLLAMLKITNEIGHTPKAIVFSDDIQWCREAMHDWHDIRFERLSEFEDLSILASCGHQIIANSTFSWWAAYLRHSTEGMVISPSHKRGSWFGWGAGVKKDCVDLLPKNWIQIERT